MERKYFKNQAEIYQALLDGKKIARNGWTKPEYCILVNGVTVTKDGHSVISDFHDYLIWYEYTEPADDTKYLWIVKSSSKGLFIADSFYTKQEASNDADCLYPVARLNEQTKKVEWL